MWIPELESPHVLAHDALGEPLQRQVQRRAQFARARARRENEVGEVRREERQVTPPVEGERQQVRLSDVRRRLHQLPASLQPRACRTQRGRFVCLRRATLRRLRNQHQRHALGQCETRRGLAEVHATGRAHALHVATVGHTVQVRLEDLALGIAHLEPEGAQDLREFAEQRARAQSVVQPRKLHGEGGRPLRRTSTQHRARRTQQRERVDTRVTVKVTVLVQQQQVDEFRRHVGERRPQPVLPIGRERQAQQPAVAVEYGGRGRDPDRQRRPRPEPHDRNRREHHEQRHHQPPCREPRPACARAPRPDAHGRSIVSRVPVERPSTPRSYIASPNAGGTLKVPVLVALIR